MSRYKLPLVFVLGFLLGVAWLSADLPSSHPARRAAEGLGALAQAALALAILGCAAAVFAFDVIEARRREPPAGDGGSGGAPAGPP